MRKQGQQNILKKHQRSPKKTQRSKQQLKNQIPHFSTINKTTSKPNQPIQYIYSKVNKNIQQSIDRLRTFIDKTSKQLNANGNTQSADSKLQQQYKKLNQLIKQLQQNSEKLVKTLFQYYYEVMVNVEVLLNQQLFPQKQMRSMFPKIYETMDSLKAPCSITYDSVLLPPIICQNDLRLVYYSLTNKASLILDKQNDLYQTPKPKELVNFYIKLIDLAEFIKEILKELLECIMLRKQLKVNSSKLNQFFKQKAYFSSETRQILLMLVQFVNQKMQQQHIQTFKSTQSINTKRLFLSCFKHSMEFIQKIFFYNFIVSCHSCLTKKSISYHQICSESQQLEPIGIQYTDMKLRLLRFTMRKPDILKRIFKQSLSFKLIQIFIDKWNTEQFNYQNFYLYSFPIAEEQKMIELLIKYQIHYALFVLDLISEVSCKENITFKNIYNCYRHMLMILTANVTFRTIKVIEREIKYCHGDWVHQRVLQKRNHSVRWEDCVNKLSKTIQYSSERFKSYLPDKNQKSLSKQKKSDNQKQMEKLQMQNATLISMIKQLNLEYENNIVQTPQKQQQLHHKINQIYSQLYNILSKVLFNQNQFTKICRRLCKRFDIKFTKFQQFMSNPFQLKQPDNYNQQKSKKQLQLFQKQFKIVQIEMLKIYNIFTTLPFYSFVTELQRARLDELKTTRSKIKSYQQTFKNLQVMYIHNRQVLNTAYLNHMNRTMKQINDILQYQTGLTQMLNGFFQTWNQQQKDGQISHIDDPKTVKIYKYSPVPIKNFIPILKGKAFIAQQQKQQKQTIDELMTQSTFNTTNTTAYKKKLNRGQNYNFDLNLVVNRQIHKNTVTNISRYNSWQIKKLIVQKFLTDASNFKSIINNNSIRRNFRFSYRQNQKLFKHENQSESQMPIDNQKQNESNHSMKKMKIKYTQGRISPTKGQSHQLQQKRTFQPEDEPQNSIITDKTPTHQKSNYSNSSKYDFETGI